MSTTRPVRPGHGGDGPIRAARTVLSRPRLGLALDEVKGSFLALSERFDPLILGELPGSSRTASRIAICRRVVDATQPIRRRSSPPDSTDPSDRPPSPTGFPYPPTNIRVGDLPGKRLPLCKPPPSATERRNPTPKSQARCERVPHPTETALPNPTTRLTHGKQASERKARQRRPGRARAAGQRA